MQVRKMLEKFAWAISRTKKKKKKKTFFDVPENLILKSRLQILKTPRFITNIDGYVISAQIFFLYPLFPSDAHGDFFFFLKSNKLHWGTTVTVKSQGYSGVVSELRGERHFMWSFSLSSLLVLVERGLSRQKAIRRNLLSKSSMRMIIQI